MNDTVLLDIAGAVAVVTLNRPDRLNALTDEMFVALRAHLDRIETDDAIRAVLLTGAGRGFCAGADLLQSIGGDAPADLGVVIERDYNPLVLRLRALPKPVLCAVNGVAAGAGMNLALAADVVIAARSASFTQAFVRIGLLPDAGGTYFLPRLVGEGRAKAMAMLGETISAADALEFGLLWKLFDDDVFATEARTMAANLAAKPSGALAAMKAALNAAGGNSLAAQLELERDLQRQLGYGPDFAEGVAAFKEKRPAVFAGKVG